MPTKPAQRVQDLRPRQAVFSASIKQFPKRLVIVSEGDSWFSYPLCCNLADYIEMQNDFSMLRLEHNGDDARDIFAKGSGQLKNLKQYLKTYPVDLLMLSAGGNDIVSGELKNILGNKANGSWQSSVRADTLTTVLDDIVAGYNRLLDLRDELRPNCTVVAHSYCYFVPNGRKATGPFGLLSSGPWMKPVLVKRGIDPDVDGRAVSRYLIDNLHKRLSALATVRRRFHVIDMRDALSEDVHWADEIHPSGTGFRKLVEERWRPALKTLFPNRGFD
jgi:hypothetical protein